MPSRITVNRRAQKKGFGVPDDGTGRYGSVNLWDKGKDLTKAYQPILDQSLNYTDKTQQLIYKNDRQARQDAMKDMFPYEKQKQVYNLGLKGMELSSAEYQARINNEVGLGQNQNVAQAESNRSSEWNKQFNRENYLNEPMNQSKTDELNAFFERSSQSQLDRANDAAKFRMNKQFEERRYQQERADNQRESNRNYRLQERQLANEQQRINNENQNYMLQYKLGKQQGVASLLSSMRYS